jgi:hydroxyacylglutathione hydrolase
MQQRGATIVGGEHDNVPACDLPVKDGQIIEIGRVKITCHHTPCHTKGHILYVCEVADVQDNHQSKKTEHGYQSSAGIKQCIFTGDTIFIGGCGRFFEGTPDQMVAAMQVAVKYPDAWMFCGHEYTL